MIKTFSIEDIAHLLVEGVSTKDTRFMFVLVDDHQAEVERLVRERDNARGELDWMRIELKRLAHEVDRNDRVRNAMREFLKEDGL